MATAKRLAEVELWVVLLALAGLYLFWPTLQPSTTWVFEDSNVLPWTGPFPQTFRPAQMIWAILRLADPWQYHLLNLGVHALTSVMVGAVAMLLFGSHEPPRLFDLASIDSAALDGPRVVWLSSSGPMVYGTIKRSTGVAWACGSIFWLHPLAVPSVGYASALPEMLVGLGAVTLTWILLQDRTWYWLCTAAAILAIALSVKFSAIGVLLIPAVTLIVRPIRWKESAGWIVALVFLAILVGLTLETPLDFVRTNYPWHRWPEEMLPMAAQAFGLAAQSFVPLNIAFQADPMPTWSGAYGWIVIAFMVFTCLVTTTRRWQAVAILYVLALITVRLVVPASNWPDRAPEMWYTQQWYPALPGMVWLLVGFFADDAFRGEPSAD